MHTGDGVPQVEVTASLSEALMEMTQKSLGMTAVVAADGRLAGIFTDGDLRRMLDSEVDARHTCIAEVMTRECVTVHADMLAAQALKIMEQHAINALLVVDADRRPVGALNTHVLLRSGAL